VIREGEILLLREPQDVEFRLPGGGIHEGELPFDAVERELREETGMALISAAYLFDYCDFWAADSADYWGQVHSVFSVKAAGDVALSDEHCEFVWWSDAANLPLLDYVKPMLGMMKGTG